MWTWAVAFLPSVTTAVLHDRNLYGGSALAWLAAALTGALSAGAVLGIAHLALRQRRSLAGVLIVFAVAGVARGLGVGGSAWALGLVDDPQWLVRAASGAVLAIFWLSIATVIVDGFRTHRHTRTQLAAREAEVRSEVEKTSAELTALRARAQSDVGSEVSRVTRVLHSLPEDDAAARIALQGAAVRLHDLSSEVVRPLSHAVASTPQDPIRRTETRTRPSRAAAIRTILIDAMTVDPFRPVWLAVLLFPSILMTAIRNYGPGLGLLGAAWIVAMAAAMLAIAERVITPRLPHWRMWVRTLAVLSIWAVSAVASALPVAWASAWGLGPERAWAIFGVPLLAYVPITCLGIAIATAISQAWALDEDTRAARIAALDWQQARQQQELWSERQRLGRHLHGAVQSTLTATALAIEAGVRRGTPTADVRDDALARLEPMLTAQSVTPPAVDALAVDDVLASIARVWSRLADVIVTIHDSASASLFEDPAAADKVVEVAREGIANAIRHGHARHVTVVIDQTSAGAIEITVNDDGTLTTNARAGLGSATLDDLCLEWSRSGSSTGTVLHCRIPVGASAPTAA